MMIIGVDAGCLGVRDNGLKAGVYYFAVNLLKELSRLDTQNTYLLYSFYPIHKELMQQFSPKSKNVVLPSKGWLYLSLPAAFLRQKPDVFLALSQAMPKYHPFRTIGFIHALDFLPEFHAERNDKLKKNSEYVIKHSERIITTSQFLKSSLAKQYKRTDIIAAHLGIDKVFFTNKDTYSSDKPYFLFVGTLKPSKNIPVLLKAFSRFLRQSEKEYVLLCVGSDFWLDGEIGKVINDLKLNTHVQFVPFVENKGLAKYYQGAAAFVSPSLYEGFGLTFVEAMASGCPVIASNVGAIPEVVGDAGLLYDPNDVEGISDAMLKIVKDKRLRDQLITSGKMKAKEFRWEKFAGTVLNVIDNAKVHS